MEGEKQKKRMVEFSEDVHVDVRSLNKFYL